MIPKIFDFLTQTILGLIILSAIGSLTSLLLIWSSKKIWKIFIKQRFKIWIRSKLKAIAHDYSEGYLAGQSILSSFRQTVLTGRYIIKLMKLSLTLILLSILCLVLIIISSKVFYPIIFFVYGLIILFPFRSLKKTMEIYNKLFDSVFDTDQVDEATEKHIKKIIEKMSKKENDE
jgi:hypothetical protein